MLLSKFLKRNKIEIGKKYLELCEEGIRRMKNSKDINHDHTHVEDMIGLLDKLIKNEQKINKHEIDYEILLPAICWHDVWMAGRQQANNIIILLYQKVYEGMGSSRIFKKYIRDNNLKIDKSKQIDKLVFYHAEYRFIPVIRQIERSLEITELDILSDLDNIASMNLDRIKNTSNMYINKGSSDPILCRTAFFYVRRITLNKNSDHLHFHYSRKLYKKRRARAVKAMINILEKMLTRKEYYFDTDKFNYYFIKYFDPDISEVRKELEK